MRKAVINLSFDDEKLCAARMYMTKKDSDFDTEMLSHLEKLYEKYVPANVRDFISDRNNESENNLPRRSPEQAGNLN